MIEFSFDRVQRFQNPFPHFAGENAIDAGFADSLLDWLESEAPWELKIADFYEQYEFSLWDANLPAHLRVLTDRDSISALASTMEQQFGAVVARDRIDVTAHRLNKGQMIRIHNDYIEGEETHRLLVQLNRGWSEKNGGVLMLFEGDRPEDVVCLVHPMHRLVFGFEISPVSHHAVTPIVSGDRFTLVFSFYAP